MRPVIDIAESADGEPGIGLGSSDGGEAEGGLEGHQVSSVGAKVGAETMADNAGYDVPADVCLVPEAHDYALQHRGGETAAHSVHEKRRIPPTSPNSHLSLGDEGSDGSVTVGSHGNGPGSGTVRAFVGHATPS